LSLQSKAVGYRHGWWLNFGWIGRREEAILSVSAGFNQISIAPRQDGIAISCS
jgi:hypothetical protein